MIITIPGLILVPLFLLTVFFVVRNKKWTSYTTSQKITVISFIFYCFSVVYLTFFPFQIATGDYKNLTPWTSRINLDPVVDISALPNLIMLSPLTVYYYLMKKDSSLVKAIGLGFGVSFSIEFLQFLSNYFLGGWRGADIADIVVNTLGAAFGYLVVKALFKKQEPSSFYQSFKLYA